MAHTANKEIRSAAKTANVRLWQIAACLGISDAHFSRKLRFELPADERERIMEIIANISSQKVQVC
ncbi:MAG: hypothetical protein IJY40_02480 [Oscillospiraceae bacterium]|nr:hypothetical protein [Oscillospiraceae bacterium]